MESSEILSLIERAHFFSESLKNKSHIPQVLQNTVVTNLFFEHSTRTKFSFEVAAKRLGAYVLNFHSESSSLAKGETLYDTLRTFEALGTDIAIIRHSDDSYIESLKDKHYFSVINAGAGRFEHPSQSLLDLFTIHQEFKQINNLTILICGDIINSRVARSNINALKKFNCKILLAGPAQLLPSATEIESHCEVVNIDDGLKRADVAMFLRVQHERHDLYELNTNNYNKLYGLNQERLELMPKHAIFMHPGPFNRDVEIEGYLIEHKKSRIFKQKENGVYTRMSILEWIKS